jgi:hypothetical protein
LSIIHAYRDKGLPVPIDLSVLERAGVAETLSSRVRQSLQLLELIDDQGKPTAAMEELAKAGGAEYPERFAALLRSVYQEVFQFTEPRDDTPEKVRDAFRAYKPRGQQGRMVTLFIGLCGEAGLIDEDQKRKATSGLRNRPKAKVAKASKASSASETKAERVQERAEHTHSPPPSSGQHPLIRGLIQSLPEAGSEWPQRARNAWVKAALANFDLVYELPPGDREGGDPGS